MALAPSGGACMFLGKLNLGVRSRLEEELSLGLWRIFETFRDKCIIRMK